MCSSKRHRMIYGPGVKVKANVVLFLAVQSARGGELSNMRKKPRRGDNGE